QLGNFRFSTAERLLDREWRSTPSREAATLLRERLPLWQKTFSLHPCCLSEDKRVRDNARPFHPSHYFERHGAELRWRCWHRLVDKFRFRDRALRMPFVEIEFLRP